MKVSYADNHQLAVCIANAIRRDVDKNGVDQINNCLELTSQTEDGDLGAKCIESVRTQLKGLVVCLPTGVEARLTRDVGDRSEMICTTSLEFFRGKNSVPSPFKEPEYLFVAQNQKIRLQCRVVTSDVQCHTARVVMYRAVEDGVEIDVKSDFLPREKVWNQSIIRVRYQLSRLTETLRKHTVVSEKDKHTWLQKIDPFLDHVTLTHVICMIMQESPDIKFASFTRKHTVVTIMVLSKLTPIQCISYAETWLKTNWSSIVVGEPRTTNHEPRTTD